MEQMICSAKLDYVYHVIAFVNERASGITDELQRSRLELAVEEIYVNIVNYAYEGSEGEVEIQCGIEQNMLLIRFKDSGIPFDMTKVAKPDINASAGERPIGGLGVFFVHEIMDYVNYEYRENKNVLTVGMKLSDESTS